MGNRVWLEPFSAESPESWDTLMSGAAMLTMMGRRVHLGAPYQKEKGYRQLFLPPRESLLRLDKALLNDYAAFNMDPKRATEGPSLTDLRMACLQPFANTCASFAAVAF